jgi:hypothetical protein
MSAKGLFSLAVLLVLLVTPALGQLRKRVEKCLPYPTLAQEIMEMYPEQPKAKVNVHVISVEFDATNGIPSEDQEEISKELQSLTFGGDADAAYLNDIANEIAEVGVKGPLQDRGYFRATTAARLRLLEESGAEVRVAATISAQPGPQYRTGNIRIETADGSSPLLMSPEVLRGLIPLQRGELLSVKRLREGLTRITQAYVREGYVDATTGPDFEIDEDRETVDMVLKIDQQIQYRIGSIEILGPNFAMREKLMESFPKIGEIFDGTRIEEFFKVNRSILPPDVSREDVNLRRDVKNRTVAILLAFWTSPQTN